MSRRRFVWALEDVTECDCGGYQIIWTDQQTTDAGRCHACQKPLTRGGYTVEVGGDYVGQRRNGGLTSEGEIYGKLQATDGADISSRRKHRDYMKANGLAMTEDFKETWAAARAERERLRTTSEAVWTEGGEPVRPRGGKVEYSRNLPSIRAAVVETMKRAGKL